MQQNIKIVEIVAGIIGLLLIATVTLAATKRLKLPFTVILVLVGIGLSLVSAKFPNIMPSLHYVQISPELILYVFLPTLIFESAYNLDVRQLRENLGAVLMLSVPGLLLSTLLIGVIVAMATPIPLTSALLLGAILSATDPVAVIGLFKRLGVPQRLKILVEGESLFNDATSIVLARILLGIVIGGKLSAETMRKGVFDFIIVFIGGAVVGWVLGLLIGYFIGKVSDHHIEITLTTILAYMSFLLAEEVFHVSGIMATIAAGLTIGGWGRVKISAPVKAYFDHFWEYLAFIANGLIFLMVGLRVDLSALSASAGLLCWVIIAMLISRAVVVYGLIPLVEKFPGTEPINRAYQTIIYWGGLRGAIALAIVLSLPSFHDSQIFVALVMGSVLFTLLIQGLTIELLMRRLGLDRLLLADYLSLLEGGFIAKQQALSQLPKLLASEFFSTNIAERLSIRYEEKLKSLKAELERLHQGELDNDDKQRMLLYIRVFNEEKSLYINLFNKAQLSERVFRQLLIMLDLQIDAARFTGVYQEPQPERLYRHQLESLILKLLDRISWLAPLAERLRIDQIAVDYEIAWGCFQSSVKALELLDSLTRLESMPWYIVDKARRQYREKSQFAQRKLDQISDQFPEFVSDRQERLAQKLLLFAEAEAIKQQADRGILPEAMAEKRMAEITEELHNLQSNKIAKIKVDPIELLRKVPFCQSLSITDLANIAVRMRMLTYSEQEHIIRQGETGDSMFILARGVVRICRTEQAITHDLATLISGDYFGEISLLKSEKHNIGVIAITSCVLYKLHKDDLKVVTTTHPTILNYLEEEIQRREALNPSS